jgi:hypothetical protein
MVVLIIVAKLVADALTPGIYEWQVKQAGYVFLEAVDTRHAVERAAVVHFQVCVCVCLGGGELREGRLVAMLS